MFEVSLLVLLNFTFTITLCSQSERTNLSGDRAMETAYLQQRKSKSIAIVL